MPSPKNGVTQVVGAMAALALSLAPQAASATEIVLEQPNTPLLHELSDTEPTDCGKKEPCKEKKPKDKQKWQPLKGQILPPSLDRTRERELKNGWHLNVDLIDLDLQPRWEDGPALKIKGDFLETSLQKTKELDGGWKTNKGVRAELRGEIRTYDKPQLDLKLDLFQSWEGPLSQDYKAKFDAGVGFMERFVGQEGEEGLYAGVRARQQIEGGGFSLWGTDYDWYLEGREHAYHNFSTGKTHAHYRVMAGPKRDFKIKALGREAKLSVTVGPELKGDLNRPLRLGVATKVKIKL